MEITQAQKYEILEHELLNGAGLEEILKKCLEILMKSEREIHNENYWITAMAIVTERFTVVFEELYGKKYSTSSKPYVRLCPKGKANILGCQANSKTSV